MKKESKMYIRNVMHGRDFIIDFISAAIAVGIIIMVVLNSVGSTAEMYFVEIFVFGAVLAFLNGVKKLRARSSLSILFGMFGVILLVAAVMCYMRV